VISDTHDLLRPEALRALAGVDEICTPATSATPRCAATSIEQPGRALPDSVALDRVGRRVLLLHDRNRPAPEAAAAYDIVIAGHSHRVLNEVREGVLHFNPGGAGP